MGMKEFVHYLKTEFSTRFIRNYRIGLFVLFICAGVIANSWWNNANKAESDYLKSLNLNLAFKIVDIKPTGNHGYGVIYGHVIKSNKPPIYDAIYRDKYTFCKVKNNKVLFVSPFELVEKNDSLVIQSNLAKYWVYRKSKLIAEYNLTITTDFFLYSDLEKGKYLDFSTYKN